MLNNRWFVIGLAGVAMFLIATRVVVPLLKQVDNERAIIADSDEFDVDVESGIAGSGIDSRDQGEQFENAQYAISAVDVAALHWQERPARDPFSKTVNRQPLIEVKTTEASAPTALARAAVVRWPSVSAVVDSRQHQFAVVDGVIRKPGDRFGGFELRAIERQTVSLAHLASRNTRKIEVTIQ